MKKLFLVAAALFIGGATYAQTSSTGTTKFGLKAGVNLPKYKYENSNGSSYETEANTNFHITGYADVPLASSFSIQPGISFQGKGGKVAISGGGERKDDIMSIEIPLNLVGHLPAGAGNFFIGAGPYVGFNIAGKREIKGSFLGFADSKEDIKFGNSSSDDIKPVDFGINGLIGYQFDNGLNLGAGYGMGLSNLAPGSNPSADSKVNHRVLSFSIGVAF